MLMEIKNKRLNDNIIKLKDRYLKQYQEANQKKPWQRITKEYLFIVTDYLPHTICDLNVNYTIYLNPNGQETPFAPSNTTPQQTTLAKQKCLESIRQVMHGVFKGLKDLHSIGITHRDIKLSNILIDNDRLPVTRVKICDLGSSKKLLSDPKD
jgi:serine/threonine protein kinase